jgi:hypothetical protein
MTRGNFLKTIVTALLAPKVLTELELTPVSVLEPLLPVVENTIKAREKLALYWKVSNQMLEDEGFVKYLLDPVYSPLLKQCRMSGIDITKPYGYTIDYNDRDFEMNMKTIVITQYK